MGDSVTLCKSHTCTKAKTLYPLKLYQLGEYFCPSPPPPSPPPPTHCSMDGIVVAEEYEEVLREAWQQQEQLLIEKDIQKREARVLERWKRLTRCLLIRERVKRTYERVNATS